MMIWRCPCRASLFCVGAEEEYEKGDAPETSPEPVNGGIMKIRIHWFFFLK